MSIQKKTAFPASLKPLKTNNAGRCFYHTDTSESFPFPDLIEIQVNSYNWFIKEGLKELFNEINPIVDSTGKKLKVEILNFEVEPPKNTMEESCRKGLSYESSVKSHIAMTNLETGEIKEQDVYFGQIPVMTPKGVFIINGIDRIIVNQIVRSPGIFFAKNPSVIGMHTAKMIPKRGAWLEIETDKRGVLWVKVDRKRKIPVTMLLRAFGYSSDKEIIEIFKDSITDKENNPITKTLAKDDSEDVKTACQGVYKRIRPGDLATADNAQNFIEGLFFDYKKYDLGPIARYKINKRFKLKTKNDQEGRIFRTEDFIEMIKELIHLNKNPQDLTDDIDHLANRRIRGVGELIQNKFRVGLLRTERIIRDRMSIVEIEDTTPAHLINCRPITAAMHEFFASSQLSQFMDQTNPLAEIEHKRRISAMGPGGLSRERASFEVRDVHPSHYGRICPVTTPEGPNIGLVLHLASFARVNDMGFIETPYRTVKNTVKNDAKYLINKILTEDCIEGKKTIIKAGELIDEKIAKKINKARKADEVIEVQPYITKTVEYYDAEEEKDMCIAQANSILDEHGNFVKTLVSARKNFVPGTYASEQISHIDISPKQIVSLSTAMIAFLEHDDNTRALMGSNMQRQAVPLVNPESPIIGTGMEDSFSVEQCVIAPEQGIVKTAYANKVIFFGDSGKKYAYNIKNYHRTNQSTCFHQRVRVEEGQKLKSGDLIADGASMKMGEMALGRNLTVAYMSWGGYNYEDAIIVSDRIVREGVFNSIHIEKYDITVRDTKLGEEELTADIPNVAATKLQNLDDNGIIRIGTTVLAGDILVGKVTPKGETELTAEDKLLRAIFGEKARDVRDTSLRLPRGSGGKVIGIEVLDRNDGGELPTGVLKKVTIQVAQMRHLEVGDKMAGRHGNKGVISRIVPSEDMPYTADGTPVDIILNPLGVSSRMNIGQVMETHLGLAAKKLGIKIATPVLDGIRLDKIQEFLRETGFSEDGKMQLFDGRTGEPFDHQTVVGTVYMLKLIHLVEDKIHARSVGPYSLVTQQPLGGKAQNGGQRFGEMEVWALEAYAVPHILQEMLTVKSDDVYGRSRTYESIVKNESLDVVNLPESFNVLIKELQSLCLRVDLLKEGKIEIDAAKLEQEEEQKPPTIDLIKESEDASIVNDDSEEIVEDINEDADPSEEDLIKGSEDIVIPSDEEEK